MTSQTIGNDGRVEASQMREIVSVIDRCGDVEAFHSGEGSMVNRKWQKDYWVNRDSLP